MCTKKLFFFFLIQNICCGCSKELSQWDGSFEHPKHMIKLVGKKMFTSLRLKFLFVLTCGYIYIIINSLEWVLIVKKSSVTTTHSNQILITLKPKELKFPTYLIYNFLITKVRGVLITLGLSHIIFSIFVPELWPLIYSKISFPFNILRTNGQNFTKILYMHSYLRWDCYASVFAHLYQSYGPWFTPKFRFCSISWEQMGRFWPNFI